MKMSLSFIYCSSVTFSSRMTRTFLEIGVVSKTAATDDQITLRRSPVAPRPPRDIRHGHVEIDTATEQTETGIVERQIVDIDSRLLPYFLFCFPHLNHRIRYELFRSDTDRLEPV